MLEGSSEAKIFVLTNTLPPYREHLFDKLRESYKHLTLYIDTSQEFGRNWPSNTKTINTVKVKSFKIRKRSQKRGQYNFPLNLIRYLLKGKPDLMISSEMGFRTLTAIIYKKLRKNVALVLWLGLSEHTESSIGKLRTLFRRWMCNQSELIYVTGKSGNKYIEHLNSSTKVISSPQASYVKDESLNTFEENLIRQVSELKNIKMLFVGPDYPIKNFSGLIKLFKECKLDAKLLQSITLVTVGLSQYAQEELESSGLQFVNIPFLKHGKMSNLYKAIDILVFPTLSDEWGLVVNEALLNGVPILGSIYSQAVMDLLDESVGWIFDPNNQTSFNNALQGILGSWKDQLQWETYKQRCKKRAKQFDIQDFAETFSNVIQIALEKSDFKRQFTTVSVVMPYVNIYREPFLIKSQESLAKRAINLKVYAGKPLSSQKQNSDQILNPIFHLLSQFQLSIFQYLLVFRWIPKKLLKSRLLIYDQGLSHIDLYLSLLFCKLTGRKFALWGHGHTITKLVSRRYIRLQTFILGQADWFFAYTEGSARRTRDLGFHKNITIMNNTLEFTPILDPSTVLERRNAQSHWQALYIGALSKDKKAEELFNIANKIHAKFPEFRLLIAGQGEIYKDFSNHEAYEFIGYITNDDKVRLARECRILINPGRIGLVAIDSLSLGLPLLGLKDELHAPEVEYLNQNNSVISESIDELIDSIVQLIENPELLNMLSEQCIIDSYSYGIQEMVNNFANGITQCLES